MRRQDVSGRPQMTLSNSSFVLILSILFILSKSPNPVCTGFAFRTLRFYCTLT
jgi:hypothetical protein